MDRLLAVFSSAILLHPLLPTLTPAFSFSKMSVLTPITTGISAFVATNLDDMVILILFFSQVNSLFRRRHVVYGQYLGFTLLILVSLPGFFGGLLVPRAWIGLLGTVPILIGVNRLFEHSISSDSVAAESISANYTAAESIPEDSGEAEFAAEPLAEPQLAHFLSPQIYSVAALTIANGSDNIGIYVPLFANCTWESLTLILILFLLLVGVWCYAAEQLTHLPAVAQILTEYGDRFVPYGLIGLGGLILWESQTLADRGLTVIALLICIGYLNYWQNLLGTAEIEEN
jgi:cadmium resistance protein CadD (predicted permease)